MIKVLSTNITSPLGLTTKENYHAVKAGSSALRVQNNWRKVPQEFTASLFNEEQEELLHVDGFTRYESIVIHSIKEALSHLDIDIKSDRVALVLSTTKANVEELSSSVENDGCYRKPGESAVKIANFIGFTTDPVVVCNACISGVTAQILADRLINSGSYDTVVVCGADCQSPFVVAGFMSFKSLSPYECRPFDIERLGLNLGDAAATIVFGKVSAPDTSWKLVAGTLNNDAYHVSAPSPVGDGTYAAAKSVLETIDPESLATVSVHGTATMFNDQMESKAIERSGLSEIPISALKGYYGHTLGAAGVLETIITMEATDDGIILPVRGYSEIGVSGKINVSDQSRSTDKKSFLKLISGFGGCNGAVVFSRSDEFPYAEYTKKEIRTLSEVKITPTSLIVDGNIEDVASTGKNLLAEIYKSYVGDYPKFHKMDVFTKLAFLAADIVTQRGVDDHDENRAVILFNSSSSIVADRNHIATFDKEGEFYPSPSVFLYTLPNIVTGEISIKHGYKGETSLYILNDYNEKIINSIVESTFAQSSVKTMITGWVDCTSEDDFEANIKLVTI
jgi:3-oxoacyl-[acyl-carrier-protein] synthase-1